MERECERVKDKGGGSEKGWERITEEVRSQRRRERRDEGFAHLDEVTLLEDDGGVLRQRREMSNAIVDGDARGESNALLTLGRTKVSAAWSKGGERDKR